VSVLTLIANDITPIGRGVDSSRDFRRVLRLIAKRILVVPEMGNFEWDILNPDRIINLEIKNEWRTSNI